MERQLAERIYRELWVIGALPKTQEPRFITEEIDAIEKVLRDYRPAPA